MEKESFEDKEVAEILNSRYISIKVDREERPDIDSVYMSVCQAYTGSGGWPLTIIMTPDKKPFFAGTYFPKERKYNISGLKELLISLWKYWEVDREKVYEFSREFLNGLYKNHDNKEADIDKNIITKAFKQIKNEYDSLYGGFSKEPKFPTPHNLFFLLNYYEKENDKVALDMVENTLKNMYKGGIFDHIGYGFARYSTDEKWLVPHFEKMIYDNALLSIAYAKTYYITKDELYRDISEKILKYIIVNMRHNKGGFYCGEDADSEGIEGKFYVWEKQQIEDVLNEEEAEIFCNIYGVTEEGNFEGKNILNLIGKDLNYIEKNPHLKRNLEEMKNKLFKEREQRIHPHKDDKILTSWNGMTIGAFSMAGRIFQNKEYINIAEENFKFIMNNLFKEDKRLMRRYRDGETKHLGILDDYAFLIWGTIELYETTLKKEYIEKAFKLTEDMIEIFLDKNNGGFFLYGKDAEKLIINPKEIYDGAIPSGNSMAILDLIKLNKIANDEKFSKIINKYFKIFGEEFNKVPLLYINSMNSIISNK